MSNEGFRIRTGESNWNSGCGVAASASWLDAEKYEKDWLIIIGELGEVSPFLFLTQHEMALITLITFFQYISCLLKIPLTKFSHSLILAPSLYYGKNLPARISFAIKSLLI